MKKWESEIMHIQYIRSIDILVVSEEDSFECLLRGDLKAEIESDTTAAHDKTIETKYRATKVLKTETDSNNMTRK